VIVAHVAGLPVEETLATLAPVLVVGLAALRARPRRRRRRH